MTNKQKIRELDRVLALLGGPDGAKRWCQGMNAQDKDGHTIKCESKKAVRFCAVGALRRTKAGRELYVEISCALCATPDQCISYINDEQGRGAVLRFLRSYKKKLEAAV